MSGRTIEIAYALLFHACLACGLSCVTPFWVLIPEVEITSMTIFNSDNWDNWITGRWSEGLFADCYYKEDDRMKTRCVWFWENDFKWQKARPDWHKAVQGLFAAGLLLCIIGWVVATFHIFCRKQSSSVGSALGSLTLSGSILITAAIIVFGEYSTKDREADFENDHLKFYFAFFVGIAGCALAFLSVILFFCDGCRGREHTGYHMTRVV